VVKLVQAADAGTVAVAVTVPSAVGVGVTVAVAGADVTVELGLADVVGGVACGPHAVSRTTRKTA
jgi:hypothetical protein